MNKGKYPTGAQYVEKGYTDNRDDSEFEPGASCHPEKERSTGKSFIVIVNLEDKFSSDVLRIIPASHTDVHRLEKLERDYLKSIPTTPMSLPQGSVVVMNKCTYFRYTTSSARLDSASKPLLFFSFLHLSSFFV